MIPSRKSLLLARAIGFQGSRRPERRLFLRGRGEAPPPSTRLGAGSWLALLLLVFASFGLGCWVSDNLP
jgi:hypothetical protein